MEMALQSVEAMASIELLQPQVSWPMDMALQLAEAMVSIELLQPQVS